MWFLSFNFKSLITTKYLFWRVLWCTTSFLQFKMKYWKALFCYLELYYNALFLSALNSAKNRSLGRTQNTFGTLIWRLKIHFLINHHKNMLNSIMNIFSLQGMVDQLFHFLFSTSVQYNCLLHKTSSHRTWTYRKKVILYIEGQGIKRVKKA